MAAYPFTDPRRAQRPMIFTQPRLPTFSSSNDVNQINPAAYLNDPYAGRPPPHANFTGGRMPVFTSAAELYGGRSPTSPTFGGGVGGGGGGERPRTHKDDYVNKYAAWKNSSYSDYRAAVDRVGKTDEQLKAEAEEAARAEADALAAEVAGGGVEVVKSKEERRKEKEREKRKEAKEKEKRREEREKEKERERKEKRREEKAKEKEREEERERERKERKERKRRESAASDGAKVGVLAGAVEGAVLEDGGVPLSPKEGKGDKKVKFEKVRKVREVKITKPVKEKGKETEVKKEKKVEKSSKKEVKTSKKDKGGGKGDAEPGRGIEIVDPASPGDDGGVMVFDVGPAGEGAPLAGLDDPVPPPPAPVDVVVEEAAAAAEIVEVPSPVEVVTETLVDEEVKEAEAIVADEVVAQVVKEEKVIEKSIDAEGTEVVKETTTTEGIKEVRESGAGEVEDAAPKEEASGKKVRFEEPAGKSASDAAPEVLPEPVEVDAAVATEKPKRVKISEELFGSDDDSDLDRSVTDSDAGMAFLGGLEDAPGDKKGKKKSKGK